MSYIRGSAFWNLIGFSPVIQKTVLGNIGNESVFKINSTDKSRRFNQYFDVFLFGKIYSQNTWILGKIWEFETDLVWKLKHIILEIFWPELLKLINSY